MNFMSSFWCKTEWTSPREANPYHFIQHLPKLTQFRTFSKQMKTWFYINITTGGVQLNYTKATWVVGSIWIFFTVRTIRWTTQGVYWSYWASFELYLNYTAGVLVILTLIWTINELQRWLNGQVLVLKQLPYKLWGVSWSKLIPTEFSIGTRGRGRLCIFQTYNLK